MPDDVLTRRALVKLGGLGALSLALPSHVIAGLAPYDVVIRGGRVIDPETKLDLVRNVGISGGRVRAISARPLDGRKIIDATGLVVAPGFIDPISHGQNLENDRLQIMDGVTTKLQLESGAAELPAWYASQTGKRICNYGAGAGHGYARQAVMGEKEAEYGESTDAQIAEMAKRLDASVRQGALGVGFGIEYRPGTTRWELFEMFRVAAAHGASCHVHMRYGTVMENESALSAVEEVISVAIATGAPLHIVHVPSMALANTAKALAIIEGAQRHGVDVTCDFYPYTAFATGISSAVFDEGWQKKFAIDYGDLEWAATHERMTAESFARFRKQGGTAVAHAIPEAAVRAAVASSATMVGSDGSLDKGVGHPRSSGTYARILGRYVREAKLISLMTAIEKMSLRPAKRLERRCPDFKRKGRLQVGADADIVMFDPKRVIDRATFDQPALTSVGFQHVLVGGEVVVQEGKLREDARTGRSLRAPIG